jgi:archaeosine synthase beta-subunit
LVGLEVMDFDESNLVREGKVVLSKAMKRIRVGGLTESNGSGYFVIPSEDGLANQALMWIPTRGCSYALGNGGCTMCDFGGTSNVVSERCMLGELRMLLESKEISGKPIVNLGGQGSFFDDVEYPPRVRENILKEIAKRDWVEVFTCESRPEFMSEEKIKQLREVLGKKWLEIGIGTESSNSLIREGIINKGLSKESYDKMMRLARKYEVWISHHVFFKPLLLTEREAIEDAVLTIRDLLRDVDETHPTLRVILMTANVKPNTLLGYAYKKGFYSPPLVWSCIEILKRLTDVERSYVKVLGFDTGVEPLTYARNGDESDAEIVSKIKQFDRDHDISPLLELEKKYANSVSMRDWQERLREESVSLESRMRSFYRRLVEDFSSEFRGVEFVEF